MKIDEATARAGVPPRDPAAVDCRGRRWNIEAVRSAIDDARELVGEQVDMLNAMRLAVLGLESLEQLENSDAGSLLSLIAGHREAFGKIETLLDVALGRCPPATETPLAPASE